ncbi:putative mobilization protein BF0133 [Bacteroides pyogenes JCM 10003]|nr:putative mobilization protein BF0133 [Bacteroides pyogenes JCM 10003]
MKEQIQLNYERIKQDVKQIVIDEMERIKSDPELQHLVKSEE